MKGQLSFSVLIRAGAFLLFPVFQGCNPTSGPSGNSLTANIVLPDWVSGQFGTYTMTANGGTPPYVCNLNAGSALPMGFALAANCALSGTAPFLAAGSAKTISPPFTVIFTDQAQPSDSISVVLRITIIQPPPQIIILTPPGPILKGQLDSVLIAQAMGGYWPYTFSSDTYRYGAPPMGMIIDVNGFLRGTPILEGVYTFGVCVTDLSAATSCSTATVTVVKSLDTLRVIKIGDGTVSSSPPGINCGITCSATFVSDTSVTLVATPAMGSTFAGWSGACTGVGSCIVTMDSIKTVTATFTAVQEVFTGIFSGTLDGPLPNRTGSNGCQYDLSFSGTMTLTFTSNGNGAINYFYPSVTGTNTIVYTVIYSPPGQNCSLAPSTRTADGVVQGGPVNISGTFSTGFFRMPWTGIRNGNIMTCSGTANYDFVGTGSSSLTSSILNFTLTKQ